MTLRPPLDANGTPIWSRTVAANINRARRQVAASKRTPWRRPKTS